MSSSSPGDSLDEVRRRVQQETTGHRGKKGDPLYQARRTLHTGCQLLTERQQQRIVALFADENHADVEVTWERVPRHHHRLPQPGPNRGEEVAAVDHRLHLVRGAGLVLSSCAGWGGR